MYMTARVLRGPKGFVKGNQRDLDEITGKPRRPTPSNIEKKLDDMRALVSRDLADAGIAGLSAERRFATAYNAALQAANIAIAVPATA